MSANSGRVSDGLKAISGQVCIAQNGVNQPMSDGSDRFGQVFTTTSPTRTHKGFRENLSKPVQMCPDEFYEGPITADLSTTDWANLLPAILTDAQAYFAGGPIEPMREHWRGASREYRAVIGSMMGVK